MTNAVPQLSYRPDIDGLRAIAVLAVMAFHATPGFLPGGFAGVDVFFVISGFLISKIILRALAQRNFSCLDFYARRVLRIFPALILILIAVWVCGWLLLLPDKYQLLGEHTVAGAGFMANFSLYGDFGWYFGLGTDPLLHLWSLGVEEQFYLLWPLFLIAIWKFGQRRLFLIVTVATLSFVLNVTAASSYPLACFYLPWNRRSDRIYFRLRNLQIHCAFLPTEHKW